MHMTFSSAGQKDVIWSVFSLTGSCCCLEKRSMAQQTKGYLKRGLQFYTGSGLNNTSNCHTHTQSLKIKLICVGIVDTSGEFKVDSTHEGNGSLKTLSSAALMANVRSSVLGGVMVNMTGTNGFNI